MLKRAIFPDLICSATHWRLRFSVRRLRLAQLFVFGSAQAFQKDKYAVDAAVPHRMAVLLRCFIFFANLL